MLSSTLEQKIHYPLNEKKGVTAIVATVRSGPELRPKAKKNKFSKTKLVVKKSQRQK